jgi:cytochrome P450
MEFQPQRWVSESAIEGSFAPFGAGSRACLGRRFSETEFIAVLSTILREYRVELATTERETKEQARARAEEALRKSETYMTLSVGGIVPLKFVKRTPRSL